MRRVLYCFDAHLTSNKAIQYVRPFRLNAFRKRIDESSHVVGVKAIVGREQ